MVYLQKNKPPFRRHAPLTVGEREQADCKARDNPCHYSIKTNGLLQGEIL